MSDSSASWNAWFDRHGPAAFLFARQLTRSPADAEEAVQEGFIRFWRNRNSARDPLAFLFSCVRTAALDQHRSTNRRTHRERLAIADRPLFALPEESADRGRMIEQALSELPPNQREVVILKIWGGLTLAQIAQTLNESANTVASRYRYALEKLEVALRAEVSDE